MDKEKAELLKDKGNKAYGKQNYKDAIDFYTSAIGIFINIIIIIGINDQESTYFVNRATAFLALRR